MCVFCATIPAALAVGAKVNARQIRMRREAEQRGEPSLEEKLPVGKLTIVAVGTLIAASAVYHSQLNG
jgi:hypothetical protein